MCVLYRVLPSFINNKMRFGKGGTYGMSGLTHAMYFDLF